MDVGVQINQYKIIEHIGRGGMADVWSARDTRLNRMVAIKTIAHGLSPDVDSVEMFKQEAQTIARMEHPHILPIYDFGEFEGQLYIVMRFVAGGSLEDMLRRGPLSVEETLRMGRAIAEALEYAHSNKVVHLDLKPPNVLLDNRQSPYLADFGLATVMDLEGKASNPGSGTLLYMAPEQMTSDVVDHHADIYSFCIVLFHMLTGQLPFQGAIPMAIKQVQGRGELPNVTELNASLPTFLNDILKRGTSIEISRRPETVTAILDEITQMLASSTGYVPVLSRLVGGADDESDSFQMRADQMAANITDMEVLEALDIYTRARHAWAGGNGRFLLGLTHFMIMNGYYMYAEQHGLELDEAGTQMLLRGALEFDVEVGFWWNQLDGDNRRWVCLHTVRSGTAPARVRALYRLETLSDSEKPVIPKLVAQALQVETDEAAQLAALKVLGTRFELMQQESHYQVLTEYRGRMLTTMTRLGVQVRPQELSDEWREAIYAPEIDTLIAETALDDRSPKVAELAARIVGRMRSITSVRHIAEAQKAGRPGALRALALIRDEAPSLPSVVSSGGRLYAWLANTALRLTDKPLAIVWRYLFAMFGGWLALGLHIFTTFRGQVIFEQQRWANAIAMGLVFGVIVGFVAIAGDELPARLRKFWPVWGRTIMSLVFGTFFGAVAWWSWGWLFLGVEPYAGTLLFGGLGVALGYTLTTTFNLRAAVAVPLTALLTYLPIFLSYTVGQWYEPLGPFGTAESPRLIQIYEPLLYYSRLADDFMTLLKSERIYTVAIPFALLVALGGYFQATVREGLAFVKGVRPKRKQDKRSTREFAPVPAQPASAALPANEAVAAPAAAALPMATELDAQRRLTVYEAGTDEHAETEQVRSVDTPLAEAALPAARQQAEMAAIDPSLVATDADLSAAASSATEERSGFRNVNFGKGFKLDIGSMKTELDAQRALREGQDEPEEH